MPTTIPTTKAKEFWETDEWKKYLMQGAVPTPVTGMPKINAGEITAQAIQPITAAYKKQIPVIESRVSKRGMGRSGAYVAAETEALQNYLTQVAGTSGDIALQSAQLQLDAAKAGMSQQQYKESLMWEKQKKSMEQTIAERETVLAEESTAEQQGLAREMAEKGWGFTQQELDLRMKELGMTSEQFNATLDWQKETFGRTFSFEEMKFEKQLELEWADQGLNQQEVDDKKAMFYDQLKANQDQFNRDYTLKETIATQQHDEELSRQGLTQQEITNAKDEFDKRLVWEQEQFGRTLEQSDRQFEDQLELEWKRTGLTEKEIDDKKEMFYDELKANQEQFNRDYSLRETSEMNRHTEELRGFELTEEQMADARDQFNRTLIWEQDKYGQTLDWEERKSADELAFALKELLQNGDIQYKQMADAMQMFDDTLKGWTDKDGTYHPGTVGLEEARNQLARDLQDQQLALQRDLDQQKIDITKFDSETARLPAENDMKLKFGWDDENGVHHAGEMELEQQKNDMYQNQIFGYWDKGFEPDKFEGEKYNYLTEVEWKSIHSKLRGDIAAVEGKLLRETSKMSLAEIEKLSTQMSILKKRLRDMEATGWKEGMSEYDENGNVIYTQEWNTYMSEHYHKGELDLKEYQQRIDGLLGTRGVSNE
jgi:hypothetical protein